MRNFDCRNTFYFFKVFIEVSLIFSFFKFLVHSKVIQLVRICIFGFFSIIVYYAGDSALIPGWRRSPGGGNGNWLHILTWRIPWTEEPDGLQQRVGHD